VRSVSLYSLFYLRSINKVLQIRFFFKKISNIIKLNYSVFIMRKKLEEQKKYT